MPHPGSKLDAHDVYLIRKAAEERDRLRADANKLSNAQLAKKFRVSETTISCVINRWYHYGS